MRLVRKSLLTRQNSLIVFVFIDSDAVLIEIHREDRNERNVEHTGEEGEGENEDGPGGIEVEVEDHEDEEEDDDDEEEEEEDEDEEEVDEDDDEDRRSDGK